MTSERCVSWTAVRQARYVMFSYGRIRTHSGKQISDRPLNSGSNSTLSTFSVKTAMKTAKELINTQKAPAQEHPVYSEKDMAIAKKLFQSMKAQYGAIFTANLDDKATMDTWMRSWTASIRGKRTETVARALTHCLDTFPKPFTRADFQQAYRAFTPQAMHKRNKDALALPSKTWQERKAYGAEMIKKAKAEINKAQ